MRKDVRIQVISPTLLEVSWPAKVDESTLLEMTGFKHALSDRFDKYLVDARMGYHSLMLRFRPERDASSFSPEIEELLSHEANLVKSQRKRWKIPVCYHPSLAKDLLPFASTKRLEVEEVAALHSQPDYLLHFYGFLPGFMYLGGLNPKLHLPRKAVPDRQVERGSVAIGGQQTGIYPVDSPGGWHVIGKTPLVLFDTRSQVLPPFSPGDRIRFFPVSVEVFESLQKQPDFQLSYEDI